MNKKYFFQTINLAQGLPETNIPALCLMGPLKLNLPPTGLCDHFLNTDCWGNEHCQTYLESNLWIDYGYNWRMWYWQIVNFILFSIGLSRHFSNLVHYDIVYKLIYEIGKNNCHSIMGWQISWEKTNGKRPVQKIEVA